MSNALGDAGATAISSTLKVSYILYSEEVWVGGWIYQYKLRNIFFEIYMLGSAYVYKSTRYLIVIYCGLPYLFKSHYLSDMLL